MVKNCSNELGPSNLIKLAEELKGGKANSSAMVQVINHLLIQPHTTASLVKKIGVYSSAYISSCLRRLRKAGLIDSVWDHKLLCLVYYNLKLERLRGLF